MAIKDYYAILMVHPKAASFLIEAAYKRLAREYHPDLGNQPTNHEKMIEINEAYAVLSNPARRAMFDEEYAGQTRSRQASINVAHATATNKRNAGRPSPPAKPPHKNADARWGNICPATPKPTAFGIDAGYFKRAMEGAQVWKLREHRIPERVKWTTRIICSLVGITLPLLLFRTPWLSLRKVSFLAGVMLLLVGELSMRLIERIRDAHLLRYKFNPIYNPNPAGYQAYASAFAKYEADTVRVYVARNSIYHTNKTCRDITSYEPMPKWFARYQNARPCARCGRVASIAPRKLPPPFGKGTLPNL